ncbi:MAG: 1-acyl-sn-glycerol-3-phosphate acyltransferase [Xanthomonadales bacterium]|nr:1-acyl-sn-glycerol-3-phosphate acyltransferase [Xanthomonadales bacterium]
MKFLWRGLMSLWVRAEVRPEDALRQIVAATAAPVCYVLERRSAADVAVVADICRRNGLPPPDGRLVGRRADAVRATLPLLTKRGFFDRRIDRRPPPELVRLIEALQADRGFDVRLVPMAVYWGRAPQKEGSWLRLWLTEGWVLGGALRKMLQILVNGRFTMVEVGAPVSLRSLLFDDEPAMLQATRITRAWRATFRRQRAARIGPDMSHRRTILARVLRTRAVRAAAAQEVRTKRITRRKALLTARGYGEEIAANYSHAFITFMEAFLRRLWNRLYDGVSFNHVETLRDVAREHEVVFVPCHRSHMDYLLLSYAIYTQGYAVPHIAAGINLDIPVIGRFLRKAGAFFIRRSFAGNALYTAVLMKYLATIMARGHSLEYFIEGGRSRTGRLLQPKTGMLAMTVRSYARDPRRPVVFLPVYFGYERIVEGNTYLSELSGRPKRKESIGDLLRATRVLREKFGAPVVDELAQRIMRNINAAAAVTPVNLLALVLLAMPRKAMAVADLERQVDLCLGLLREAPYDPRTTVSATTGAEVIAYGDAMRLLQRHPHPLGELVQLREEVAVLTTYYRNNIQHLFALPSLIACAFIANPVVPTADIQRLAWRVYPYVAAELFLKWPEEELAAQVERVLAALGLLGLLEPLQLPDGTPGWRRPPPNAAAATQLSLLARASVQTIERYYLVIAALTHSGSGTQTAKGLAERCQLMAQRIDMLYGLNSPEFADRSLFDHFIALLLRRGVIRCDDAGRLLHDEVLQRVARDAEFVLSEQIRHSILQVTGS